MNKSMLTGVLPLLLLICTLLHVCTKEVTEPAPNVAPQFRMHFTDTAVVAKNPLLLTLQANDENNDRLVFRGLVVPAGASLDSVTGLFFWTPDSTMAGKKDTLLFEATDGELADSLELYITVKTFQLSKKRYYVPGDFPTIQLAVNAAKHGDTIIVMPGKYENFTYKSKALVIASRYLTSKNEADITGTIIKRQGDTATTSLVDLSRCPDSIAPVVLMGFTLRYGYTKYGGAISVSSCSPQISHCIIDSNYAVGSTWAWVPAGGGVRLYSSGAKLINCRIINNFCGKLGGGIIMQSCSNGVTIDSCVIQNNRTSFEKDGCNGGGLFCDTSKVSISNSTILGNTGRDGGGLYISHSSVSFYNCVIAKNKAEQYGGGLYIAETSPSDSITFNHCVVVSNEGNTNADSTGGAVYISTTGTTLVAKNSIFWMSKPQAFIGSVTVTYSFVQEPCAGMGNITDQPDPLFNSLTNNDFILKPGSPCIGKADDGKDMGLLF